MAFRTYFLCIAALLMLPAVLVLPQESYANHENIIPSLLPPEKDRYYDGDRVTYNLTFFFGNPGGHADLGADGYTVGYNVRYYQQRITPLDSYVFERTAGLSGGPPRTNFTNLYPIDHDLTTGTWRISVGIHDRDSQPEQILTWFKDIEVYPLAQQQPPDEPEPFNWTPVASIASAVIAGGVALFIYFHRRRPKFRLEWLEENVANKGNYVHKIRIWLLEGHADRVRVSVEWTLLTWERDGMPEKNMSARDGGNLVLPRGLVNPDHKVKLRWGNRGVMTKRLRDIPKVKP